MRTKRSLCFVLLVAMLLSCCAMALTGCKKDKECQHIWSEATCTAPKTCTTCGATEGNALGHTGGEATCLAGATCSRCSTVYAPALGHDFHQIELVNASCEEDGYVLHECARCHTTAFEALEQLSHHYTSKVEGGTCTEDTLTTYICDHCSNSYTEITERSKGHDLQGCTWVPVSEVAGTESEICTVTVTESTVCNTCSQTVTRVWTKHVPVYTGSVTGSTCSTKGKVEYVCACGNEEYTYTAELPLATEAHNWQEASGKDYTHICLDCQTTKTEIIKIADENGKVSITPAELAGENPSISINQNGTESALLRPDDSLLGQMSEGVDLTAKPLTPEEVTIKPELSDKLEGAPIFNFDLQKAGQSVAFNGGKMTISIPYELAEGEDPTCVTVWYIDENGDAHEKEATWAAGFATFVADHFSVYTVVRLTPAERCAKLGHDVQTQTFSATCTEDGYVLHICRRCGNTEREETETRHGHNYAPTVVQPTCTERGYTIMICSNENCKDQYITAYIEKTAHQYTIVTVDPTCTQKGYTQFTCDNCKYSYKGNFTNTVPHNFLGNTCTVCGAKSQVNADNTFYLNMISNFLQNKGESLTINNLQFTCDRTNDEYGTETVNVFINLPSFVYTIDENGLLAGEGKGYAKILEGTEDDLEFSYDGEVTVVLSGGYVYVYQQVDDSYISAPLYEMEGMDFLPTMMFTSPEITGLFNAILRADIPDNPLNKAIEKIVNAVFDKTAVTDGYTFTLNYDKLEALLKLAQTETPAQIFDRLFGTGAFENLYRFAYNLPTLTVDQARNELVTKLGKIGLTSADLFKVIDMIFNMATDEEFSTAAFLTEYKDYTVTELILLMQGGDAENAEEMSAALQEKIKEVFETFNNPEMPLLAFLMSITDMMPTAKDKEPVPDTPIAVPDKNPSIETFAEDSDQMSEEELNQFMQEKALEFYKSCWNIAKNGGVSVTLTTDLLGNVLSSNILFNFETEAELPEAHRSGPNEAPVLEYYTYHILLKGSVEVTPPTAVSGKYNFIMVNTEKAKELLATMDGTLTLPYDTGTYTTVNSPYGKVLAPVIGKNPSWSLEMEDAVQTTYNGVNCTRIPASLYQRVFFLEESSYFMTVKSCSGWREYQVEVASAYCYVDIYVDANGELLGMEYNFELCHEEATSHRSLRFYYNTALGTFSTEEPHRYVLVDSHIPTVCEETGFKKYRCTACGEVKEEHLYKSHDTEWSYVLAENAHSCTEGLINVGVCKVCNKVCYQYAVTNPGHYTYQQTADLELPKAKCGTVSIEYYGCACGENMYNVQVCGDCEFDCVWAECTGDYRNGHFLYRCAVNDCAYTYTIDYSTSAKDENCYDTTTKTIRFSNGATFTTYSRNLNHNTDYETHYDEQGIRITTNTCRDCHRLVREEHEQVIEIGDRTFNRTIYYYYNYSDSSFNCYTVQYDGCSATRQYYDRDGKVTGTSTGDSHLWIYTTLNEGSCTQPHYEQQECALCHTIIQDSYPYYQGEHRYYYSDERSCYICRYCGTTSATGADGPVMLEDMTYTGDFRVGYYRRDSRPIRSIVIYADYGTDEERILNISIQDIPTDSECGILYLDIDSVDLTGVKTISVVFTSDGASDTLLESALTFTLEELAEKDIL